MKQNNESITPLRKYIAIGYAVIALLIGGIVFIYLQEWRELERIEAESKVMNMLRQKVHDAYAQMLDLTLYGEKVLEWNAEDTLIYRDKRLAMDSILCEFKQYYRPERLDSLCRLLSDKEQQLFNIWDLYTRQEALNERIATEVPIIPSRRICYPPFFEYQGLRPEIITGISNPYLYTLGLQARVNEKEQLSCTIVVVYQYNCVTLQQTIRKIMPKIFEYFGFIFYFYSNEHEPIHVHVLHGGRESIFDLIMMNGELLEVRVREKKSAEPLPEKDKRIAEEFIRKYHKNIIDKWVKFFIMKQAVRSTNIKKKI